MTREINYKVPGGKLVRIEADVQGGTIRTIQITGDFFVHPETGITLIENALAGERLEDVCTIVDKVVGENSLLLVGFGAADLAKAMEPLL